MEDREEDGWVYEEGGGRGNYAGILIGKELITPRFLHLIVSPWRDVGLLCTASDLCTIYMQYVCLLRVDGRNFTRYEVEEVLSQWEDRFKISNVDRCGCL